MKRKTLIRWLPAALIAVAVLIPASLSAYDFQEGGIYYNLLGNQQVAVTYNNKSVYDYQGRVVIPEKVTHGGVTYKVTAIGTGAFQNSGITEVEIPNTVTRIETHGFQNSRSLQLVVVPNSVTELGRCVFHMCTSLKSAVIGNSVKIIDEYCFQYCYVMTDVIIGSSVDSLAIKAFFECHQLANVTCLAPTPPAMYAYYCFDSYSYATLHVNSASIDAYRADENWKRFHIIESLSPLAEQLTLDKTSITLHGGECQQLTAVVLPEDASPFITWSSSDPDVATVDANGVVSAVAAGQAVITARTADGSDLSATCRVRVLSNGVQDNNVLTMPEMMTVEKGKPCLLPIGMTNNAAITALQCDITLPDGFELATDGGNYLIDLVESRVKASHGLYARSLAPNVVRVVITSAQSEAFVGNDGDLMVLHLNVGNGMADGEYNVTLTNVILADAAAVTYYAPDAVTVFDVKSYAKGDANGDGMVNVGDYVTVANYILNTNPDPFIFSAADVDENGTIDVGDLVGVANIVLGDFVMPAPHHGDGEVSLSGSSVNTNDNRVVVTLNLDNEVALTAWQMNVALPDGMTLAQANLTSRASNHNLAVNEQADGSLMLLGSSAVNDVVTGHEGALLTLVLEGSANDGATLSVSDAVLAEADMTTHAVSPFQVSIGNSAVKEMCADVRIYTQGGDIIVETPIDTTVELIAPNGMTRVVEAKAGVNTYRGERGICIVRAAGQVAKLNVR